MYSQSNVSRIDCGRRINIINAFRKLWEQHVVWTRLFVISNVDGLRDLEPTTKRLLRNPADFADELRRYYGLEKADRFRVLLTEHLTIAAELVDAAKAGDREAVGQIRRRWYQNAEDIAAFLASINPFWSRRKWRDMLFEHLRLLEDEVSFRISGQYALDVANFDRIEAQALEMADIMSAGIIKQFEL
jgi:hypothetical protein